MKSVALIIGLILLVGITVVGCSTPQPTVDINSSPIIRIITVNETVAVNTTIPLSSDADFQLLRIKPRTLASVGTEVLIIDPYETNLSAREIQLFEGELYAIVPMERILRTQPFFNETWRVGKPNFITHRSGSTYEVKYWDREFQELVYEEVQRLAALGYDGVYLQGVNEYRNYDDFRRGEMKEFIRGIYNNGQVMGTEFGIIIEDAPELILDGSYSSYIMGYAQGEVWYQGSRPAPFEERDRVLSLLQLAAREGKKVFVVEYPQPQNAICDFYTKCSDEGFYCTITTKDWKRVEPVRCL